MDESHALAPGSGAIEWHNGAAMKKVLELLICIVHPVAVVLIWINLPKRHDLSGLGKAVWAIFGVFPFIPLVYVLTGGDFW
jgi:hypothetical protein